MYQRFFLVLALMMCGFWAHTQVYPQADFQTPMDTPLYLSAPFGSLRDNHFHSGMDIRTNEKEGYPVYAIADGYVVRIKYSPYGYGKAVYINHPNGYTSVYGHLQNANGPIAAYIKKYQYEIRSFDFDHFPGKDKIRVKKGDTIGWSGNSGGSTGPHLHFEIRNTRSEEIINPQLFGIPVIDEETPVIQSVYVYVIETQGGTLLKRYPLQSRNTLVTDSGTWLLDTLMIPLQMMGFALDANDYLVGRSKEYSLYGMDFHLDDKPYFSFRMNRFAFSDSRSINRYIDYGYYKKEGTRIQKLFVEDGNTAKVYTYLRNKGRYQPTDTMMHLVSFTVYDYAMHAFRLFAYTKAVPMALPLVTTNKAVTCYPGKMVTFQNALCKVEVPAGAVYDTLSIDYEVLPKEHNLLSATHRVHDIYRPLARNISISIKPDDASFPDKLLMAYSTNGRNWRSAGGKFENGFVTTRNNVFGYYAVSIDTIAPQVKALFKSTLQASDTVSLRFKITDNFSGIDSYKLTINGKWALAEYDAKSDLLEYFFDENTPKGKLEIELTVTDNKGNTTNLSTTIDARP
jgi:murein DD-endopeptidase MepM/ murein hydrolase activator NlpD